MIYITGDTHSEYERRLSAASFPEQKEMPTEEEMQHGLETLKKHGWQCDVVITHAAPQSIQGMIVAEGENELTAYLEEIRKRLDYRYWFFGHYHNDGWVTEKDALLYHQIVRVV